LETAVSDVSVGFVYRFPDDDFEVGFGSRVPDVGHTVKAKGRTWTVAQVGSDSQQRAIVNLEPVAGGTDPETASAS
jgi:hypothetical protein